MPSHAEQTEGERDKKKKKAAKKQKGKTENRVTNSKACAHSRGLNASTATQEGEVKIKRIVGGLWTKKCFRHRKSHPLGANEVRHTTRSYEQQSNEERAKILKFRGQAFKGIGRKSKLAEGNSFKGAQ